jgi:hypothetical protein
MRRPQNFMRHSQGFLRDSQNFMRRSQGFLRRSAKGLALLGFDTQRFETEAQKRLRIIP